MQLDGSGSGDPEGGTLSFQWSQVYGLDSTIEDRQTPSPTVHLPGNGIYVFELEVSDGTYTDRDRVMVWWESTQEPHFVLHFSVDALRSDIIDTLGPEHLPGLFFLREFGAFTHGARTDAGYSVTLPNHTSQLTGRPVDGDLGHGWNLNYAPAELTLAENRGRYVASVFDVVHDHELRTAMYSGKTKSTLR